MSVSGFDSKLGQQQFMQLMTAQLMHQNPLEPTKQEDFLAQMAQFSTLSGIESLNSNFSELFKLQALTQGASLVGKQVTYTSPITKQSTTGVVSAASVAGGKLQIHVNNEKVGLDDISNVGASAPAV